MHMPVKFCNSNESSNMLSHTFSNPPCRVCAQYESGSLSPLGDEVLPLLQSMITHGGFYGPHFLQTFHTALSSYTGHQTMLTKAILTAVNAGEPYPWAASQDGSAACLLKVGALESACW